MSIFKPHRWGHYDDNGQWQREKYCFVWCGSKCDCGPPNGEHYDSAHDKREPKASAAWETCAHKFEQWFGPVLKCRCGATTMVSMDGQSKPIFGP